MMGHIERVVSREFVKRGLRFVLPQYESSYIGKPPTYNHFYK